MEWSCSFGIKWIGIFITSPFSSFKILRFSFKKGCDRRFLPSLVQPTLSSKPTCGLAFFKVWGLGQGFIRTWEQRSESWVWTGRLNGNLIAFCSLGSGSRTPMCRTSRRIEAACVWPESRSADFLTNHNQITMQRQTTDVALQLSLSKWMIWKKFDSTW